MPKQLKLKPKEKLRVEDESQQPHDSQAGCYSHSPGRQHSRKLSTSADFIQFLAEYLIYSSVAAGLCLRHPPLPTRQPGREHQVPGGRVLHPPPLPARPHHGHPGQRLLVVQPLPLRLHDRAGRDGPPQQAERGRARLQSDHPAGLLQAVRRTRNTTEQAAQYRDVQT